MLTLQNISAAYRKGKENRIIEHVDLHLTPGEVLGVIGRNGVGKSTLARAILQQIPHHEGLVYFDGTQLTGKPTYQCINTGIGYFPQGGRIFPNLTPRENLAFAGRHLTKKELKNKISELQEVNPRLVSNTKDPAGYLSGGQKNLLCLVMVLLREPKLLILDEPAAGLTEKNANSLYNTLDIILTHKQQSNKIFSVIIIEHRLQQLFRFADQVVELKEKQLIPIEKYYKGITLNEFESIIKN